VSIFKIAVKVVLLILLLSLSFYGILQTRNYFATRDAEAQILDIHSKIKIGDSVSAVESILDLKKVEYGRYDAMDNPEVWLKNPNQIKFIYRDVRHGIVSTSIQIVIEFDENWKMRSWEENELLTGL
jgi:hypothetical protein